MQGGVLSMCITACVVYEACDGQDRYKEHASSGIRECVQYECQHEYNNSDFLG